MIWLEKSNVQKQQAGDIIFKELSSLIHTEDSNIFLKVFLTKHKQNGFILKSWF